jgi:hypothetical protein
MSRILPQVKPLRNTRSEATTPDLPYWVRDLLAEMAEGPVKIQRFEARNLRRAIFGSVGLNDRPSGAGRMRLTMPDGGMLILDYEAPRGRYYDYEEERFRGHPSWVTGHVVGGAA